MAAHLQKFGPVLAVSLMVRGVYLFLFGDCYSFDLASWNRVADILQAGGNPYHETNFLNWPPLWMQLLFLFKKISLGLQVPLNTVVRVFLIGTESVLSLLLYTMLARLVPPATAGRWLLAGIALNPVAVFQVCQHCNFDVLVGFWILLAVVLLWRFHEEHAARFWLLACVALGMGALTKTVPLCLAPLLLPGWRKLHRVELLLGAILLLGPVLLGLSIVYVLGPADISDKVLGYRSLPGSFGFTGLFTCLGFPRLAAVWPRVFTVLYGLGWLALAAWLFGRETLAPRRLVTLATVLLVAVPALGPGSGLQYVYWFLPLLVLLYGLADPPARWGLRLLYAVAVVTYTIEYALNFPTYGAFWLDLVQTKPGLDLGLAVSSKAGETWVTLPLWLLYCGLVAGFGWTIGREMWRERWRDFQAGRRHRPGPLI